MFSYTVWTPDLNTVQENFVSEGGREEVGRTTSTLLAPPEGEREESTHQASKSSDPEREVLALLRRPAREPLTVFDIRNELLDLFTEFEIQAALITLVEKQLIVCSSTRGFTSAK